MPTRHTESTHEADREPVPPDSPQAQVESPSRDRMQGANGLPHQSDDEQTGVDAGDQDIDTAGTDADEQSPTKAVGTGIAPSKSRG